MKNIVFSGKLEFLSLADLIQLIGNNGATGVLMIQNESEPDPGLIYFSNGNPIDAHIGKASGPPALYSLFGWRIGNFSFSEEKSAKSKVIHKNRMELILDGLRMVDDGEIKIIGPKSTHENARISPKDPLAMPEVKGPLVDYIYVVDEESFMDGEIVAQEGKHGSWIWVVLEGTVDIVKSMENGPQVILRLGEGAFVGSFASFLPGDHVRSAAAIARGDLQLGVLDAPRLAGEFASLSPVFRRLLISYDKRLKAVTTRLLNLRMKKNTKMEVPSSLEPYTLDGERKDRLFVIKKGRVAIVRKTDYGQIHLADLDEGDLFGSCSFMETGHEPFAASVYVSPNLEVGILDENYLQREYYRQSATLKNLVEHVATCISITTQLVLDAFLNAKGGGRRRT